MTYGQIRLSKGLSVQMKKPRLTTGAFSILSLSIADGVKLVRQSREGLFSGASIYFSVTCG
jgi:hypothetical protein